MESCQVVFFSCICLSFISAVVWLGVGLGVVRPAWYIASFQTGQCRTRRYYWAGDTICDCGDDSYETKSSDGTVTNHVEHCWSYFPCVQIYVDVRTDGAGVLTNRFLHWSELDLFTKHYKQCGTSTCSRYAWTNSKYVQRFRTQYGEINTSYECLYNPDNTHEVIAVRHFQKSAIFHGLFWPGLFTGLFLLASLIIGLVLKFVR